MKSISSFRGESGIKTWLFSIARHRWSAYLRKRSTTLKTDSLSDISPGSEPYFPDTEITSDAGAIAGAVLEKESVIARQVFRSRLEGYSYYDIAQKLGISESSARVVYFRTRNRIRKELEKEGYGGE